MAKYRKKPVVVEAFQWTGGQTQTEDPIWAVEAIKNEKIWFVNEGTQSCEMCINTLEGVMFAPPGFYIIRGIKGEIYPCRPDIFEATYEPVKQLTNKGE